MNPDGGWKRWQPRATTADNVAPGEHVRWVHDVGTAAGRTYEWAAPGPRVMGTSMSGNGPQMLYVDRNGPWPNTFITPPGQTVEVWDDNGPAPLRWVLRIWSLLVQGIEKSLMWVWVRTFHRA